MAEIIAHHARIALSHTIWILEAQSVPDLVVDAVPCDIGTVFEEECSETDKKVLAIVVVSCRVVATEHLLSTPWEASARRYVVAHIKLNLNVL